jgi:hypothetical protein
MSAISSTVFAVVFAHTICLPSISSYLAGFHSQSVMLGYCISAVCLGELCSTPLFSMWYEHAPARDLAMGSLAISAIGSVLYAVAPNDYFVLLSRFIVGLAAGVQAPFFSMAAGLCKVNSRFDTLVALRSVHTAAFVLGTGVAAVATFVHTPAPGPMNHMQHMMPRYLKEMHLPNTSYSDSLGTLGDMVIPPDSYSKMGSRIWHAAAKKANAAAETARAMVAHEPTAPASVENGRRKGGAHTRALLGAQDMGAQLHGSKAHGVGTDVPAQPVNIAVGGQGTPKATMQDAPGGRARGGKAGPASESSRSLGTHGLVGVGGGGWRQYVPSGQTWQRLRKLVPRSGEELRRMVPSSDDVSVHVHGALKRIHQDALEVGQEAMQVDAMHDLGMSGIEPVPGAGSGQEGLKTDKEMAAEIGDTRMYMPQYVTAVVGHGTKAPGYLAALVAVGSAMFVWREWSHVTSYGGSWEDMRSPIVSMPLSQLNPRVNRNLPHLAPTLALVSVEALTQLWHASVETIVAPITGIYLGFTIDATAVFLMGTGAFGVIGAAFVPVLKKNHPVRTLMYATFATSAVGLLLCIPWFGQLSLVQYVLGCYMAALGFSMLSALACQTFFRAVTKLFGDGQDMAWLFFYWRYSSMPVRVLAPLLFAYSLDLEISASLCYLMQLLAAAAALFVLWRQRRVLFHQDPGDVDCDPQFAPGSAESGGEKGGLTAGNSPAKAYGSI